MSYFFVFLQIFYFCFLNFLLVFHCYIFERHCSLSIFLIFFFPINSDSSRLTPVSCSLSSPFPVVGSLNYRLPDYCLIFSQLLDLLFLGFAFCFQSPNLLLTLLLVSRSVGYFWLGLALLSSTFLFIPGSRLKHSYLGHAFLMAEGRNKDADPNYSSTFKYHVRYSVHNICSYSISKGKSHHHTSPWSQ